MDEDDSAVGVWPVWGAAILVVEDRTVAVHRYGGHGDVSILLLVKWKDKLSRDSD